MLARFAAFLALLFAWPALAQSAAQLEHTRVELLLESAEPAPGRATTLALVLTPKPGWHTYWKNPGDSGYEMRANWQLPAGVTVSELRYPVPERLAVSGLTSYVYGRENILLANLAVPASLRAGAALPIRVKLDWLVCDDKLCVPESATLALAVRVGNGARDPSAASRFRAARAAMPSELGQPARFALANGRLVLAVPLDPDVPLRSAYFYPLADGLIDHGAPQAVGFANGLLRIETKAVPGAATRRVTGVLKLTLAGQERPLGLTLAATPGEVPGRLAPLHELTPNQLTAPLAFLLAVAGGLVLNVMPCVFPILSLKALSLARSGAAEAVARREALAYAAGVILTCFALGATLLALRAAGHSVGWAFQLQDPRMTALLLLLVLAIALNLAGLFELNIAGRSAGSALAAQGGSAGAFWTGTLAAFVATPCTGPFMGAALGAALLLPLASGLAIFAGLGLGLALPFLALGFVPALRRLLPRPGPWMNRLRRILSVPMFLTALGLVWVLGRQAGVNGMLLGAGAALLLGLALWWLGKQQHRGTARLAPAALGLAAVTAALAVVPAAVPVRAGTEPTAALAAEPFSPARLAALRTTGKPIFVYFTADWCLTCKVNEHGALTSRAVVRAFAAKGVTTLVADWTDGDPTITRFLESQGRSGVPLYLFYHPDGRVETLPQILTPGRLTALVA